MAIEWVDGDPHAATGFAITGKFIPIPHLAQGLFYKLWQQCDHAIGVAEQIHSQVEVHP